MKQNNYPQKKKEFAKEPIQIDNLRAKSRDQEQKFAKKLEQQLAKVVIVQQFAKEVMHNNNLQKG